MTYTGTIVGFRTYSYKPENSQKTYEGYSLCVRRSSDPDSSSNIVGFFCDTFSISFRDIGRYKPQLNDQVRYNLFKEDGKIRCGFVLPVDENDVPLPF